MPQTAHPYPISTRLPADVALPLGAYCDGEGLSKSEVIVRALREFLASHKPRPTAYELAVQVLAETKSKTRRVDSDNINNLKRAHFRDKRSA